MVALTGFDFDTCVKIQSPILSILMYQDTVDLAHDIIQQQLNSVTNIIRGRLGDINVGNVNSNNDSILSHIQSFDTAIYQKHASVIGSNSNHELYSSGNNLGMHNFLTYVQNKGNTGLGAKSIADVKAITLHDNNLKDFDIDYMRSVLTNYCFNLEALYLNQNPFGDNGLKCLLSGVINAPEYRNVVELHLSQCGISDEGAQYLGFHLEQGNMPATKAIDISGNNITSEGFNYFKNGIEKTPNSDIVITMSHVNTLKDAVLFFCSWFNAQAIEHQQKNTGMPWSTKNIATDHETLTHCQKALPQTALGLALGIVKQGKKLSPLSLAIKVIKSEPMDILNPELLPCVADTWGGILKQETTEEFGKLLGEEDSSSCAVM